MAGQRIRHRMEWVGERLTPDNAEAIYKSALDALRQEALDAQRSGKDPEFIWSGGNQHSIMRYLKRTLKELRFYEL